MAIIYAWGKFIPSWCIQVIFFPDVCHPYFWDLCKNSVSANGPWDVRAWSVKMLTLVAYFRILDQILLKSII